MNKQLNQIVCNPYGTAVEATPIICGEPTVVVQEVKVPTEVYSRIVGYLRPVQNWNAGKQQEFADRKPFRFDSGSETLESELRAWDSASDEALLNFENSLPEPADDPRAVATPLEVKP